MDKGSITYLGFNIRFKENEERRLYVVDHNDEHHRIYGGYFGPCDLGEFDDDLYGAIIMEISLFDGTMPLNVATFNDLASSQSLEEGCLFWQGRPLAMASILGEGQEKMTIGEVYDDDPSWFFDFMAEQCDQVRKVVNIHPVKKKEEDQVSNDPLPS